ncbi:Armadillo [Artemisia annua]|uniref:Armadillo n=1 Tax=Artemisia annua TaxID=35608 RepID=A0A2U1MDD9_ARTAN|nr:Armadillo [Artemisia annua]
MGKVAGKSILRQTTDEISSLIYLTHSITVFTSKWKLITNKLQEILELMTSIPPENQEKLTHIIQAILETTNSCNELGFKCIEHTYSGKLLMQSDLDIILVKFDSHLTALTEIVNGDGFLTNGNYAIVVSRPCVNACRDDIKFYVKDLLNRFKIGCFDIKKQALLSFNEVCLEDDKYVKIAMEIDGFVNVLVKFLGCKDLGVQEEALKAVVLICGFESYKCVLVGIGVIGQLVKVLESGSELGKELATRCLMKCTVNSDNAWSVSANGGVNALLKICGNGIGSGEDGVGGGGELVGLACGVLKNLIGVDEIRRFVVEEGAIPLCMKLIRSKNECSQISAIEFVQVLACGNEYMRGLVVNEGGIRVLVRVLDPKSVYSSKAREKSMRALVILCSDSIVYVNSLRMYGFMDHVLDFLHNGDVSIQEAALRAASWLSGTSDEFKKVMGDAGFIPVLVKFLEAKSFEAREMAAETLLCLLVVPRNQKRLVQNDQNVNLLLQMIDPEEGNSGNRKVLLSIIMLLTFCNDGKRKILSSVYMKNIEKLAEGQVLDAKKIIRNLSSNRFRSMIRGIWHS